MTPEEQKEAQEKADREKAAQERAAKYTAELSSRLPIKMRKIRLGVNTGEIYYFDRVKNDHPDHKAINVAYNLRISHSPNRSEDYIHMYEISAKEEKVYLTMGVPYEITHWGEGHPLVIKIIDMNLKPLQVITLEEIRR